LHFNSGYHSYKLNKNEAFSVKTIYYRKIRNKIWIRMYYVWIG